MNWKKFKYLIDFIPTRKKASSTKSGIDIERLEKIFGVYASPEQARPKFLEIEKDLSGNIGSLVLLTREEYFNHEIKEKLFLFRLAETPYFNQDSETIIPTKNYVWSKKTYCPLEWDLNSTQLLHAAFELNFNFKNDSLSYIQNKLPEFSTKRQWEAVSENISLRPYEILGYNLPRIEVSFKQKDTKMNNSLQSSKLYARSLVGFFFALRKDSSLIEACKLLGKEPPYSFKSVPI